MDAHPHARHRLPSPAHRRYASDPPPGPLDITNPADCLALVRHTFGRLPPESLIVIGLLDGCTGGHMRLDLKPALQEPFTCARMVADCLAGEGSSPAPEAAMVMLIGDEAASPSQHETWRCCLEALRIVLEAEYCVRIVQTWFLAAENVRDPLCADPACCGLPGLGIGELRIPTLGGLQNGLPGGDPAPLEKAAAAFLQRAPVADPRIEALLADLRTGSATHPLPETRQLRRRLHAWNLALARAAAPQQGRRIDAVAPRSEDQRATSEEPFAQARNLIELLTQLRTGFDRDLLIPLATLGLDHAMAGVRHRECLTGSPPERAEAAMLQLYAASFLGETRSRPDWERVDGLEDVLNTLVPYARGVEREHLLCLMAWIEWARGRGTAAGSFIDQCLSEFPDNELSRIIERLMQLKGVCLWARTKQHSWSWTRTTAPSPD
ncbi:DUF4192 family protein [Nesterenkonia sp. E16_7]|uniref:DUF4192 family protein n=1 Tax=unclassified Nesterenkonia TaxID=2629769 RepID=UPI001A9284FE|nr:MULTISPECIES: DUF4192 family protein [unclassified Nesterenkonia]MBO0595967.1 DUF4192 family protein [Nesterenkonia sp. E16_10]MBO0599433.1 DUF4192 family protein [Nesterenkonia sp. E16_7]